MISTSRALALSVALLGLAPSSASAQVQGAASCIAMYAQAFLDLNEAAGALRLKAEGAKDEVARSFKERPARCEPGAYGFYLTEIMRFVRRALRSGATPQTPKEGWVRGAEAALLFSPKSVPQAEYHDDLQLLQGAKSELLALVAEAGGGGAAGDLLPALLASAPQPGAYGPSPTLLLPSEPPPEIEPAPAPMSPEPPDPGREGASLADSYVTRAAALFKGARYIESAEEMRKAYLIRQKPLYLFNMAQAYRRGSRPKEALALYLEFLAKEPQTSLRNETKGYIAELEALLAEQERAEQAKLALSAEQSRGLVAQQDLRTERTRADRSERERKKPVYKRGWFWGVLTTGALLAVGVGVGVGLAPRDPPTDGGIINLSF